MTPPQNDSGSTTKAPPHIREMIQGIEGAQAQVQAEQAAEIAAKAKPGDGAPALQVPVTSDGFMTPEQFRDGLGKGQAVVGHMIGNKTLVAAPQLETWPDASAAIYDIFRDWPAAHFLLKPGGKWFMRIAALSAWAGPVGLSMIVESKEKKQAAAKAKIEAASIAPQTINADIEAAPIRAAAVQPGANSNEPETVNLELSPVAGNG